MTAFVDRSETITAVLAKLFGVTQDLSVGIAKTYNNNLKYRYFENDDVVTAVREALLAHRMLMLPSASPVTVQDNRYFQDFILTFLDVDSGEYVSLAWGGAIPCQTKKADGTLIEDDKAVGKLESYAMKYGLLKVLGIGTPDQDTEANPAIPTQRPQYPTPSQPAEQRKLANDKVAPLAQPALSEMDYNANDTGEGFTPLMQIETIENDTPRMIALHTLLGDMKINDDERHAAISAMTHGVKSSSKKLTIPEYEHFMQLLKVYHFGMKGSTKWVEAAKRIALDSSMQRTDNWMELTHAEIAIAHKKVCKLYSDHKKEIPAMYMNL